jgi:outer membrane protein OmpA-like peptidoglycan-associated protein
VKILRILPVVLFAGAAGCAASVPPQELVNARTVYDRASHGPTAQLDPTDLHTAKESLDAAEASFVENGDTQNTRDLGYTAGRRIETAESLARGITAGAQKDQTVAQMHANTEAQVQTSNAQLGRANQALASQGAEIATQGAQLQSEVQRRQAAELHAAQAAAALAKISALQVKTEVRGIVITLSGSVLFTSAKWDLLPSAQAKLNEVADALLKQDPESKIVVEGHTDSQGSAASNQELSQKRAQAVRDYLVTRGIAADRVTSQGFGPTRAIGDNASAEGRANNRRVEIVVQPTK